LDHSPNFDLTQFSEDEMRRPTPHTQYPVGLQMLDGLLGPLWKEDRPTMYGSKDQSQTTAELDIGNRYSYLCLIDQHSGEVIGQSSA
jgi:hypothetical protein